MALLVLLGAFAATCPSKHLPRYEELHAELVAEGVDQISCLLVNDAFMMFRWSKYLGVKNIFMLPDGNEEFTCKVGMLIEKTNLGFGLGSWCYSMLVNDCDIEKMFVEPGFVDNADADTVLAYM